MKMLMKHGFTLVELLIVIALLGALAIGLIGALDPFEQLKKGTDTGVRNSVSEFQSAVARYYALKGHMPWYDDADVSMTNPIPATITAGGARLQTLTGAGNPIQKIVDTGELKTNFTTLQSSQLSKITVTGDAQEVKVCFAPESKSFRADQNTKYDSSGNEITASCPNTASANCYWCVQ